MLAILASLAVAAAPPPEEVALLARALQPEGRRELESQVAPLAGLPLAEVEAELDGGRIAGRLRLVVQNRERVPWTELVLRLATGTRVDDVTVDGAAVRTRPRGGVLAVPVRLAPGARAELTLAFATPVNGAVLTAWYPTLASRAGGHWDRGEPAPFAEPVHADPSLAVATVVAPRGTQLAAGGMQLGAYGDARGRIHATFAGAGLRGALGLVVTTGGTDVTAEQDGVAVRVVSTRSAQAAQALLACAKGALGPLQARFGALPWTALTITDAADAGGATALVVVDPGHVDPFHCAHELSHQWWRALVGFDPRAAGYVAEALAQQSAVLAALDRGGVDAAESALQTSVALHYHGMRLAGGADAAIAAAATPLQWTGLAQGKAPLLFARARALLGAEAFDASLRALRRDWAFREAGVDAWRAEARDARLAELQRRWWNEAHGDEDVPAPDSMTLVDALGGSVSAVPLLMRVLPRGDGATPRELRAALQRLRPLLPELHP